MAGDPAAVLTELDRAGIDACFNYRSRLQRHGVGVRSHLRAACLVDPREAHFGQIEAVRGQWQQVFLLRQQPGSDTLVWPARSGSHRLGSPPAASGSIAARSAATGTGTQWLRRK